MPNSAYFMMNEWRDLVAPCSHGLWKSRMVRDAISGHICRLVAIILTPIILWSKKLDNYALNYKGIPLPCFLLTARVFPRSCMTTQGLKNTVPGNKLSIWFVSSERTPRVLSLKSLWLWSWCLFPCSFPSFYGLCGSYILLDTSRNPKASQNDIFLLFGVGDNY